MDTGSNTNKIIIIKANGEQIINPEKIEGLKVTMKGENNTLTIYEPYKFTNSCIYVTGDIDIVINKNCYFSDNTLIRKIRNINKNKLIIGKDFTCGTNCQIDLTDAGDVYIGDDAKWSWDIYIKSDDTHPVFDMDTKKCINKSTEVRIGNHVWIGMRVAILKNTIIPDNSVVGAYAVVTKKFTEQNVAIAGNPAKVIKRNINWGHGSIQDYINKHNS